MFEIICVSCIDNDNDDNISSIYGRLNVQIKRHKTHISEHNNNTQTISQFFHFSLSFPVTILFTWCSK